MSHEYTDQTKVMVALASHLTASGVEHNHKTGEQESYTRFNLSLVDLVDLIGRALNEGATS